ncbi:MULTISPECIES: MarR family winged helix-turn-helix transcriptional regulator [Paenibacillus]|uniref:MarR family winged helix-turn-helix transcriptional regulator n=1 Tax=Paenibacillus TaxID=44249 RepID=UPI002FE0CE4A
MENTRELLHMLTRRFGVLSKNCCTAGGAEISLVQSHILYEVSRRHKPSMQEIADALGTDITTFSRQVQSLVKMKLLKKNPDAGDRRVYNLSLTAEGQFIAASIDAQMAETFEEIFLHLTEFEKETILRSVRLLNEAMGKSSYAAAVR